VFVSTCSCVDYYTAALNKLKLYQSSHPSSSSPDTPSSQLYLPSNIYITGLHGKMVPKKRTLLYQKFVSCDHSSTAVMFCTDVAARGIDIPDVDWIIQLTAPKDPAFFIHRIGRTARAGREGNALIFVTEEERSYIELLRGRGVPMNEMDWTDQNHGLDSDPTNTHSNEDILSTIRTICHTDRDLLESGSTAFISFIRAYKENLCSYIFRMDQLAIGDVARSYSLLKLPKIAETVKFKSRIQFVEAQGVDTSAIPYQHKEKEAARQRKLQKLKVKTITSPAPTEGGGADAGGLVAPVKKESSLKKKITQELESDKRKRKKREGLHSKIMNEWEELAAEETIFKKLRKGKISQNIYDEALVGDDILEIDDVIALGNQKKRKKTQVSDEERDESDGDDEEQQQERETKSSSGDARKEMKQAKFLLKQKKAELRAKRFVGTIRQPKKQEHFSRHRSQKKEAATPTAGGSSSEKKPVFRRNK
jgi:ATP-dependent RNA helicase DDX55/SPB4